MKQMKQMKHLPPPCKGRGCFMFHVSPSGPSTFQKEGQHGELRISLQRLGVVERRAVE